MKESTFMTIFGIAVAVGIITFICLIIYFTAYPEADFLNVFLIIVISILIIPTIHLLSKPKEKERTK